MKNMNKRRGSNQSDMFSSFELKRGLIKPKREAEEVYFPKLEQSASVDTLWLAGFLDHEKRSKDRKVVRY